MHLFVEPGERHFGAANGGVRVGVSVDVGDDVEVGVRVEVGAGVGVCVWNEQEKEKMMKNIESNIFLNIFISFCQRLNSLCRRLSQISFLDCHSQ